MGNDGELIQQGFYYMSNPRCTGERVGNMYPCIQGGVGVGARGRCKSDERVHEPLHKQGAGCKSEYQECTYTSSMRWCMSWAVWSNLFDMGTRLPGSTSSLLC